VSAYAVSGAALRQWPRGQRRPTQLASATLLRAAAVDPFFRVCAKPGSADLQATPAHALSPRVSLRRGAIPVVDPAWSLVRLRPPASPRGGFAAIGLLIFPWGPFKGFRRFLPFTSRDQPIIGGILSWHNPPRRFTMFWSAPLPHLLATTRHPRHEVSSFPPTDFASIATATPGRRIDAGPTLLYPPPPRCG